MSRPSTYAVFEIASIVKTRLMIIPYFLLKKLNKATKFIAIIFFVRMLYQNNL